MATLHTRTVFFVSDGTGITAETSATPSWRSSSSSPPRALPFIDSVDKAHQVVRQVNHTADVEGRRPVVFTTLVNVDVLQVIEEGCKAMVLDMFGTFVRPLEIELGMKSSHRVGRFSDVSKSKEYHDRIEAINFSLAHDDGQSNRDLEQADVILVGVSRSGKTPTSLYLAMQHGLKAANYPLIPETFDRRSCRRAGAAPQEDLRPDDPARAAQRDPQRAPAQFALRGAGELPPRSGGSRGDDAARGHPLALHHHQVDRRDRDDHPAGDPARAAGVLKLRFTRPPPRGGAIADS
jgi:regulator of PEP synthase PpsR (kinase-PPPase family)